VEEKVANLRRFRPAMNWSPAKIFAQLGKDPTARQRSISAIDRFLQQPLTAEKKATWCNSLGPEPLRLGDSEFRQTRAANDRIVAQHSGISVEVKLHGQSLTKKGQIMFNPSDIIYTAGCS